MPALGLGEPEPEAAATVSTPDPVLAMQDSKEDAGSPPQAAPSTAPAMTYAEEVAEIMGRQMPEGNRRLALNKAKNREMTRQFDAQVRKQQGLH